MKIGDGPTVAVLWTQSESGDIDWRECSSLDEAYSSAAGVERWTDGLALGIDFDGRTLTVDELRAGTAAADRAYKERQAARPSPTYVALVTVKSPPLPYGHSPKSIEYEHTSMAEARRMYDRLRPVVGADRVSLERLPRADG